MMHDALCCADLSVAAIPARAAVVVPSLQLGAATLAGSAPGMAINFNLQNIYKCSLSHGKET